MCTAVGVANDIDLGSSFRSENASPFTKKDESSEVSRVGGSVGYTELTQRPPG